MLITPSVGSGAWRRTRLACEEALLVFPGWRFFKGGRRRPPGGARACPPGDRRPDTDHVDALSQPKQSLRERLTRLDAACGLRRHLRSGGDRLYHTHGTDRVHPCSSPPRSDSPRGAPSTLSGSVEVGPLRDEVEQDAAKWLAGSDCAALTPACRAISRFPGDLPRHRRKKIHQLAISSSNPNWISWEL